MAMIRLHNPHRAFRKSARRGPRAGSKAERPKFRRSKNFAGEGVLTYMANPKRKVFRKKKAVRRIARTSARVNNPGFRKARKRRKNAVVVIRKVSRNRAHMHFRRKARRNPEFLGGSFMGILTDFFALAGGGIGARSIPQILFTSLNTGFIGYGMNFATAFALSWLIGKKYPQKARMVFLGGTAFTLSRIVDDYFGTQLIQFAQ